MLPRFLLFACVGLSGTIIHLIALAWFHQWLLFNFLVAQAAATFIAMTSNYFVNNLTTFKNQRHFGKQQIMGLFSFYLSCSVGALINLQCANLLYQYQINWAVAGILAGISGAVWNFFTSHFFTWKQVSRQG